MEGLALGGGCLLFWNASVRNGVDKDFERPVVDGQVKRGGKCGPGTEHSAGKCINIVWLILLKVEFSLEPKVKETFHLTPPFS